MRKRWKFDLIFRESGKQDLMGDNYLRATRVLRYFVGCLGLGILRFVMCVFCICGEFIS